MIQDGVARSDRLLTFRLFGVGWFGARRDVQISWMAGPQRNIEDGVEVRDKPSSDK